MTPSFTRGKRWALIASELYTLPFFSVLAYGAWFVRRLDRPEDDFRPLRLISVLIALAAILWIRQRLQIWREAKISGRAYLDLLYKKLTESHLQARLQDPPFAKMIQTGSGFRVLVAMVFFCALLSGAGAWLGLMVPASNPGSKSSFSFWFGMAIFQLPFLWGVGFFLLRWTEARQMGVSLRIATVSWFEASYRRRRERILNPKKPWKHAKLLAGALAAGLAAWAVWGHWVPARFESARLLALLYLWMAPTLGLQVYLHER